MKLNLTTKKIDSHIYGHHIENDTQYIWECLYRSYKFYGWVNYNVKEWHVGDV